MDNLNIFDRLIRGVKRGNSPLAAWAKKCLRGLDSPVVPPLPRFLLAVLRPVYEAHFLAIMACRWALTVFYRNPVFQARCASFGRNVVLDGKLPYVTGHVQIHIGDGVYIGGNLSVASGRVLDEPKLIVKDRCILSWNLMLAVSREIVIEEDVRIAHDCRISDTDGHPREADLRRSNLPPDPKDIRPVRICRDAWIGNGSHIMKGVTVGEGAVIGANSVVIADVPPYSLAMGNPAEVIIRNFGLPSTLRKNRRAAADSPAAPAGS